MFINRAGFDEWKRDEVTKGKGSMSVAVVYLCGMAILASASVIAALAAN